MALLLFEHAFPRVHAEMQRALADCQNRDLKYVDFWVCFQKALSSGDSWTREILRIALLLANKGEYTIAPAVLDFLRFEKLCDSALRTRTLPALRHTQSGSLQRPLLQSYLMRGCAIGSFQFPWDRISLHEAALNKSPAERTWIIVKAEKAGLQAAEIDNGFGSWLGYFARTGDGPKKEMVKERYYYEKALSFRFISETSFMRADK